MRGWVLFVWLIGCLPAFAETTEWLPEEIEVLQGEESVLLADLPERLKAADVVIVGEHHDDLASHQLQYWLLQQLFKEHSAWQLGVEWFAYPQQPSLAALVSGALDEYAFLRQTDYYQNWRFDYRLIAPVVRAAQRMQRPIWALNAPKEMTQTVSKQGLTALTEQQQARLPNPLLPLSPAYRKWLVSFFNQRHLSGTAIDRALKVQAVWDQTMAKSIVEVLAQAPDRKLLVFCGQVHAGKGQAIADALRQLRPQTKVVTLAGGGFENDRADTFDYYALLPKMALPPLPVLGLSFEPDSLEVVEVQAGSVAAALGMQRGDRLTRLGEYPLETYADLKYALWLTQLKVDQVEVELAWESVLPLLDIPLSLTGSLALHQSWKVSKEK